MRVDGGNGRWYTRDHPHEIISPHVMRFEEIREWIKILTTDPAYGWCPGGVSGLGRACGYADPSALTGKLKLRWIWPKEQVRLTARIREILDGVIVPTRFAGGRVEGVYTDDPRPPVLPSARPRTIRMAATLGGLTFLAQDYRPPPRLPDFKNAFRQVPTWNPER